MWPRRPAVIVTLLALSQVIGWGTTFYLPAVLGIAIAKDLRLPVEVVFGGLSVMLLVSALLSPRIGALIDDKGASRVMMFGSVVLAAGLVTLALSRGLLGYTFAWD